jgi:hypothetical protein
MSKAEQPEKRFEESLGELEQVVHDLEDGGLGLDEQRILQLTRVEPDGQPVLQPFRHEASVRK